ncbi:MAG TPA: DNA repair protein RecO [Pirellulales bacterium]|jgi:DNA repair protein RecO (recombination protein O)|nr:DNA repair protein RecO [Pirellulales bacterium]
MSTEKAIALVLRVVEFSETSSVVTLFTREFGKVRGLAKGARRPKGPFESALDLLSLCRIVFLRKSSDALDLLTEAKLERRFRPADRDLSSLYAGYYVAELLDEMTHDYEPIPELFDSASDTLQALARGGAVANGLLRFELTALRVLGHLPALVQCAECGSPVPATGRIAFSQLAGGVLCVNCRGGKKQVVSVSAGVIRALALFADPVSEVWQRLELDRSTRGELRGVMNRFLYGLLGKKLTMHAYLNLGS